MLLKVLSNLQTRDTDRSQSILVLGFGGVGTAAALILKTIENSEVVVIEESDSRQEAAKKLGFNRVFSSLLEYKKQTQVIFLIIVLKQLDQLNPYKRDLPVLKMMEY